MLIRTNGTGTDPARKFAGKPYKVMLEILLELENDFRKKRINFVSPADKK